ncbi:hypothetical protein GCM10009092_39200 [Bowmanella denitrificans]|uniref:Uncharacterized protein n=1 Tax=Bowmanella denitrificans TaxID=366582 RepID=A0ABP3HHS8_9ALTE
MNQVYDRSLLEGSLSQMESAALNFAQRFINDGKVRMSYISQTRELSREYRAKVSSGAITAEEAAKQVQGMRNQILEAQRLRTSDVGKAIAVKLKKTGLTLSELTDKYSMNMFAKSFSNLSAANKNRVYLEIIESSGRPRPSMNAAASNYSKLGRGLLVVTIGVAGGALAGLACGPGAPVCVTIGVFVGGALGALGADFTFGWFF